MFFIISHRSVDNQDNLKPSDHNIRTHYIHRRNNIITVILVVI